MRAKSQWRDRFGRWIEMGRGIKFKFRRHDGSVVSANGVFVGATDDPNVGQIYVSKDPNGLKDGFYNINSANAQEILASLDAGYLQQRGISLGQHADGTSIGERMSEDIPDEGTIPFFDAPTGWKATKNGDTIHDWKTDDGEFMVAAAPYNVAKKTGKNFILYQNGRSVGSVKDWPEALTKVNEIDADPNNANNKDQPLFPGDPEDAKVQAKADLANKQAGFGDENPDPKARAKAAIAEFDKDGTVGNLIDSGAPSKDVLDALDNNAAWKTRYQKYFRRGDIDLPTKLDKQDWDDTEKRLNAIKGLDTEVPTDIVDRNTGHNLDLSVGDVAADGYLVPTQGNNESHDRVEFDGDNAVAALADYVNKHKDALAGGGKRLSVTFDNDNQKVVFDIVDQVQDHNEAQVLASQRGETDIYDVANSKVISVGESRDPNATGIPGNTGADQNNVSSPDANSGAEQPQQPDAGSDHPVADAAGQGNAAEEQQRSDSGADNAAPAGGKPAEGTGAGPAEHTGDQPAQQQPAADAKPVQQPADNAPAEQQPAEAPAAEDRQPAEADPGVAPLPAPAQEVVNPKDNLPDDPAQLQRMAMRLEARAALLQDSPAAHTIADTLDAIYAKLNGAAPEGSPDKPAPAEAKSVRGEESPGAAPSKVSTPEKKAPDAAPVSEKAPAQDAASAPKDAAPAPKSDAAPADAPAEKPASKADAPDLRARLEAKRKQVSDAAPAKPDAAPAQPDAAPVGGREPLAKGDKVEWTDVKGRKRTGTVSGPAKREGWYNVALDKPMKAEADSLAVNGDKLIKQDDKPSADSPDTPTQAEPAKNATPEVPTAPEQASEPTPAPEAAPEAQAPEAPQPAQPQDTLDTEIADAEATVRVAQRRLDQAGEKVDLLPLQEDLDYAQQDLKALQRIKQRRADRAGDQADLELLRQKLAEPVEPAKVESSDNTGDNNGPDANPGGQGDVPQGVGPDGGPDFGRGDSTGDEPGTLLTENERTQALVAQGIHVPQVYEIEATPENAQKFHDAIDAVRNGSKFGASVYVYDPNSSDPNNPGYAQMRLFMNKDGDAGFALKGSEIVSVFVNPNSADKGGARGLMAHAIEQGGTHLDAFDTILPKLYAKEGFVPVARVPWNDEYAPDGWDHDTFAQFNDGRPDVIFMAFDPAKRDGEYVPGAGGYVEDYDAGVAAAVAYRPQDAANAPEAPGDAPQAENAPEAPTAPAAPNPAGDVRPYKDPESGTTFFLDAAGRNQGNVQLNNADGFDAIFEGGDIRAKAVFNNPDDANAWLGEKIAQANELPVNPITHQAVGNAPEPDKVHFGIGAEDAGEPAKAALRNYMESKDLAPEDRADIERILGKNHVAVGELGDAMARAVNAPNKPVTRSQPRPAAENPVNFTNASAGLLAPDPNQIIDPNLIMADLKKNHPGHAVLPNGDVVIESRTVGNKTYDVVVRRTRRERFLTYIRETNNDTGTVRASRISNETHSYKALQTKINRAKVLVRSDNAERRFRQRRNIENLPAGENVLQNNAAQDLLDGDLPRNAAEARALGDNIVMDLINGDTINEAAAALQRLTDNPDLAKKVGKAIRDADANNQNQALAGADGTPLPSHIPYGGGDSLKEGDWVDWTDTRLTVNGKTNPNYGRVYRGQVRQLRFKTNDGAYVYSDSTYVVFPEMNREGGFKPSKQRARISSTLKKVDGQFADSSQPFFPKKKEANEQEKVASPKTAADFGVPETDKGTVLRPELPAPAVPADPEADINGEMWFGPIENPVAIPRNVFDLTRVAVARDGGMYEAKDLKPGDYILVNDTYAVVSEVQLGDTRVKISYGYYDAASEFHLSSILAPQNMRMLAKREAPAVVPSAAAEPVAAPAVHWAPEQHQVGDIVNVADIPGNRGVVLDISAPDSKGERTYLILADENNMEYSRLERYVDADNTAAQLRNATIQPAEVQIDAKWKADPASAKQKDFIRDMMAKKQLSPASKKQLEKALANPDLTKGEASAYIDELKLYKPRAQRTDVKKAEAARDDFANKLIDDILGVNQDDVDAMVARRAKEKADAAAQILDGAPEDKFGGYDVQKVQWKDALGKKFYNMKKVQGAHLQKGDLVRYGMGNSAYYLQILEDVNPGQRIKVRVVNNPKNVAPLFEDGQITHFTPRYFDFFNNVKRVGGEFSPEYFRTNPDADAENYFHAKFDGAPKVLEDYNARAQSLLENFHRGWKVVGQNFEGAINKGAFYLKLADGREIFKKDVGSDREYWNEILASKVFNALGVGDVVVAGLPNGRTLIQDKVSGDMAMNEAWKARDILENPEKYPNARYIGLLDYLFVNNDRHEGNWFVDADGQPVPIDHGHTWFDATRLPSATFAKAALGRLADLPDGWAGRKNSWDNDPIFSKAELIKAEQDIRALHSDFLAADKDEWYKFILGRIEGLIARY